MNAIELALQAGFRELNRNGGRELEVAPSGERVMAQVEDVAALADPTEIAQAKLSVYTRIHVLAASIADPRAVTTFTDPAAGRWHKVIRFEETSQNNWEWTWFCEAQRV